MLNLPFLLLFTDTGSGSTKNIAMNQWVTVNLRIKSEMRGLYVQSIGGPLGIPVGEFVEGAGCTAGATQPPHLLPFIHIVPCSFSPRVSETVSFYINYYCKI